MVLHGIFALSERKNESLFNSLVFCVKKSVILIFLPSSCLEIWQVLDGNDKLKLYIMSFFEITRKLGV